jgi:hypothetical protein
MTRNMYRRMSSPWKGQGRHDRGPVPRRHPVHARLFRALSPHPFARLSWTQTTQSPPLKPIAARRQPSPPLQTRPYTEPSAPLRSPSPPVSVASTLDPHPRETGAVNGRHNGKRYPWEGRRRRAPSLPIPPPPSSRSRHRRLHLQNPNPFPRPVFFPLLLRDELGLGLGL